MNKQMIYLAGLSLAATLCAPSLVAQKASASTHPPGVAATPPPRGQIARVEVETSDETGPFATARAALGGSAVAWGARVADGEVRIGGVEYNRRLP